MDKNELKMDVEYKLNILNEDLVQCASALDQINTKRAQTLLEIAKHQGMLEMFEKFETLE